MRSAKIAAFAIGASLLGAVYGGSAPAVEVPLPYLSAIISATTVPQDVPPDRLIPIGLRVRGTISTADGRHVPALRSVTFSFKSGLRFRSPGPVSSCPRPVLESRNGRAPCARALAGKGVAEIEDAKGRAIPVRLVAYHAGSGTSQLIRFFVVITSENPDEMENVITRLTIRPTAAGVEGTWSIPALLNGGGSIINFNLLLKRRLESEAREGGHFLSARCPRGKLESHTLAQLRDELQTDIGDQQTAGSTISNC